MIIRLFVIPNSCRTNCRDLRVRVRLAVCRIVVFGIFSGFYSIAVIDAVGLPPPWKICKHLRGPAMAGIVENVYAEPSIPPVIGEFRPTVIAAVVLVIILANG